MLITHATLVTLDWDNRLISDGALLIRDGVISDLGASADLEALYPGEERLDASGRLVLPGHVCAHTHFYAALARGMPVPAEAPSNFMQTLEHVWWRLDKALTYDDIRLSALVSLIAAIRHGTTTLIAHHSSPHAVSGSLDALAEASQEAGVRACLCYEVSDRDGVDIAKAGIKENRRFVESSRDSELLAGTFGLHASFTASDATLTEVAETARSLGVGVHLHVAEDLIDVRDSLKRSGLRVVERLLNANVLGPKTIAVGCVHLDYAEINILQDTSTRVVHNPRSDMNRALGLAKIPTMLRRGMCVGLGSDAFSSDMFEEMRAAYLLHKWRCGDGAAISADDAVSMGFRHNGLIGHQFFARPLGKLITGAYADLVFLDYDPPTPLTGENLSSHIIFGLDGTHVNTTIVGGKILMRDHQLLTLDENQVHAEARRAVRELWHRM